MSGTQDGLNNPSRDLVERLRAAGYKITPPRLAVLDVIRREGEHLNPNEILEQAKAIHPEIGRATVYRTLELLTELGIVRPIYVGDAGPTYIRPNASDEGGHHHLVCSTCGRIEDFDQCMADEMAESLSSRFGFRIDSHLLEFYGLCADCQGANCQGADWQERTSDCTSDSSPDAVRDTD